MENEDGRRCIMKMRGEIKNDYERGYVE